MDKDKRDSPPLTDSTESSNLCERVPDEIENCGGDDASVTSSISTDDNATDDDSVDHPTNDAEKTTDDNGIDDNSVDYPTNDDAKKENLLFFYDASRESLNLEQALEIKVADGTNNLSGLSERALNLLWKSEHDMSKYEELSELDDDDDSLYKSWSESIETTREWNSYSLHRSIVRILIALLSISFACFLFSIFAVIFEKSEKRSPTQLEYDAINNTDVKSNKPTLFLVTRDYTQTYNGTEIEYMDATQIKSYERILELYTRYYEAIGELGDSSGSVTTTCKIHEQKIDIIPFEKESNDEDIDLDDDSDASVVKDRWRPDDDDRRGLEIGRNRDKDMKCLNVDFTMTFASNDIDVTAYPTQFLKFMNLYIGKRHTQDDLEDLGVRVEAVNNLFEKKNTSSSDIASSPTP